MENTRPIQFNGSNIAKVLVFTLAVSASNTAHSHDIYHGIFNFNGVNCCNGHDCLRAADPKDFEPISNGYKVRSTGEIVPMNTTGFSPDANWHICRKSDLKKTIRCLLVPAGGA